jgi:polyisoprenoid-binding protein YceI
MTTTRVLVRPALIAIAMALPAIAAAQAPPLTLANARVAIAGTSNIHDFTASTTDVTVTRLAVADGVAGTGVLTAILNPGALEALDIAIKTTTLTSPKEGLDKNMYKALKAAEFPEIVFRLRRVDARGDTLRAIGVLKIAGVEKEIAFDLKTAASANTVTVTGAVPLLMTDFGIAPPKAMMGMLKTDPKITVTFETVFGIAPALTR